MAGVSRTTVSLSLRDSHKISPAVRQLVQELAAKHKYRSHPMVAALMQQIRTKRAIQDEDVIAFITSDHTEDEWKKSPWVCELWNGAAEEAHKLGFRLECYWAGPRAKNSSKLARVLYNRGIQGLVFAPMPWPHPELDFPWKHFVPMSCTASTGRMELPVVRSNHIYGVQLVLSRLIELGAKSLGIVVTEGDDTRLGRAWSAGIHIFGLNYPQVHLDYLRLPHFNDFENFAAWYERTRPDTVVSVRLEIVDFLEKLGARPGKDTAFASLDVMTEDLGRTAGLYQDPAYLGRRALQYISKSIYDQSFGLPKHAESLLVEGRFVEGASLGPLLRNVSPAAPPPPVRKRRSSKVDVSTT